MQDEPNTDFIKNKILNKYYIELDNDIKLNLSNLQQKNLLCSSIRAKWLMYLTKEKENKKKLKQAKEDLKNTLLNNSSNPTKSILQQKNEDNILKDNEQLKKILNALDQLDEIIIFLEYAWNILNDFGYNIKNVIELIKLEQV